MRSLLITVLAAVTVAGAQQAARFISESASVIALTHVRVVDGTGAPARADQTLLIDHGAIAAVGASVAIPAGARVLDLAGDTVIPGMVGMHEHMFYPAGAGTYNEMAFSFPRLYLAGGVTTIRTGGSLEPYADLNLKGATDAGRTPGPEIYPTGPYMEGVGANLQMHPLADAAEATAFVRYWASVGITNYKAYMHITHAELAAAIAAAHELHEKVTGHLCSIGYRDAAALGIDNLEHGLVVDTEFVPGKNGDECPAQNTTFDTNSRLNIAGPEVQATIKALVAAHVAVTSTLPVFETFVPNRPPLDQHVLDTMSPEAQVQYLSSRARTSGNSKSVWPVLFQKELQFERAFVAAGGHLMAGLDPTGGGGVVAGFGDQREVELLVEAGFSFEQAIQIATLNGAQYLGIADRVGSIAVGKQADLAVFQGSDITKMLIVFKRGVGYDSAKLIASARGSVGLH